MPSVYGVDDGQTERCNAGSNPSAGGDTYEDTIVEALDVLEAARFWAQADAAAAWRHSLPDDERERLAARDADVDAAFDGIE